MIFLVEIFKNYLKSEVGEAFDKDCFINNNNTIFIIVSFLFIEQLLYAFFVTKPFTLISQVHIVTALFSGGYAIISYLFKKKHYLRTFKYKSFIYHGYVLVVSLTYMIVSIYRTVYIERSSYFLIPVIYIAVLYGIAFIAIIPPNYSFLLYFSTYIIIYMIYPVNNPEIIQTTALSDLFTNHLVAFLASVITYNRYRKDYNYKVTIDQQNYKLKELSTTDMLTKLPNRRFIDLEINKCHKLAKREESIYSLILLDIDHFKRVNDTYGHTKGDQVLKELAFLLKNSLRETDLIGRWGGEEFIILCRGATLAESQEIAEKLRQKISKHSFIEGYQLTCSLGVASYQREDLIEDIFRYADLALYQSKSDGRNRVTTYKG